MHNALQGTYWTCAPRCWRSPGDKATISATGGALTCFGWSGRRIGRTRPVPTRPIGREHRRGPCPVLRLVGGACPGSGGCRPRYPQSTPWNTRSRLTILCPAPVRIGQGTDCACPKGQDCAGKYMCVGSAASRGDSKLSSLVFARLGRSRNRFAGFRLGSRGYRERKWVESRCQNQRICLFTGRGTNCRWTA